MVLSRFRHPALSAFGVLTLLAFGASDAFGVRVCVHHTGHQEPPAHGEPVVDGEAAGHPHVHGHGDDQGPGDHHDGDHGHGHGHAGHPHHDGGLVEHVGDVPDDHGHGEHDCDCGFFCVGMSGPPPVEPASVVQLRGLDIPLSPRVQPRTEEARAPPCRIPRLLPFAHGPPVHS